VAPDPGDPVRGARRLRIAIVIPGFVVDRDERGLPGIVDLVERLAAVHDVWVVALRYPSSRPPYEVVGARVVALGGGAVAGPIGRSAVMDRGIRWLLRLHRRQRLDLIHGLWADEAGAVAVIAGRLIRRPVLVSLLGGELVGLPDIGYGAALGIGGRWTASIALRGADLLTAGSSAGRDALARRRPRAKVVLAPLGVDLSQFRPADTAVPGAATMLFVGSLEPVKDPAALFRAFAALVPGRPALRLEIVGDGRLRSELEGLGRGLGIGDRVRFAGHLPRARLPDVYRSSSLLAVTSRHEGQSMVAVEAAASGLPVVGTAVGVLPDLAGGALTVPIGADAALAAALASVLDDPALAARMGAEARAVAVARFDLEQTSADMLARYDALVSGRRARRRRVSRA
jgi:glycosyltransferase involved in cell wall biosynthesis